MKYCKTDAGHAAFKARSAALPTRMRALFLLFDGNKNVSEVLQIATGLGATPEDVDYLLRAGFLHQLESAVERLPATEEIVGSADAVPEQTPGLLYARAMPIATRLTAELGLRGFRLNLAVEAAMGFDQLCELIPKIRAAVGDEKIRPLERALGLQSD